MSKRKSISGAAFHLYSELCKSCNYLIPTMYLDWLNTNLKYYHTVVNSNHSIVRKRSLKSFMYKHYRFLFVQGGKLVSKETGNRIDLNRDGLYLRPCNDFKDGKESFQVYYYNPDL